LSARNPRLQLANNDLPSTEKSETVRILSFTIEIISGVSKIMKKIFSASLIIVAACAISFAQGPTRKNDEPASQGLAPKVENGIGRADVRVFDENGNPIRDAFVKLESTRTDGFFCESWGGTDGHGIIVLPPIHMGSLKLKVKAKGYRTQELDVLRDQLGDPVRVTLKKK
jgi:hypothetical protein